jgi:hypothetical protein
MGTNERYTKPGFDARIHYYDIVKAYMINIVYTTVSGDYPKWMLLIRSLYNLICPYIKTPEALKKKIMDTQRRVDQWTIFKCTNRANQMVADSYIENKLQELTEELYTSAKHMLLPIKSDEITEYDTREFIEGSDL